MKRAIRMVDLIGNKLEIVREGGTKPLRVVKIPPAALVVRFEIFELVQEVYEWELGLELLELDHLKIRETETIGFIFDDMLERNPVVVRFEMLKLQGSKKFKLFPPLPAPAQRKVLGTRPAMSR